MVGLVGSNCTTSSIEYIYCSRQFVHTIGYECGTIAITKCMRCSIIVSIYDLIQYSSQQIRSEQHINSEYSSQHMLYTLEQMSHKNTCLIYIQQVVQLLVDSRQQRVPVSYTVSSIVGSSQYLFHMHTISCTVASREQLFYIHTVSSTVARREYLFHIQ